MMSTRPAANAAIWPVPGEGHALAVGQDLLPQLLELVVAHVLVPEQIHMGVPT